MQFQTFGCLKEKKPKLTFHNSHFTLDKTMAVNLTSGAISKIWAGACTWKDLKPVVQVIYIDLHRSRTRDKKEWCFVGLSDGSFQHYGFIASELFYIDHKLLHEGSIVQLTKFRLTKLRNSDGLITSKSDILGFNLNVIRSKCGIIGDPKILSDNETPLVERTTLTIRDEDQIHANSHHVEEPPTSKQKHDHLRDIDLNEEPPTSKQKHDHVDSHLNEDIDDSHHVEEPPTSIKNPSTSTKRCSSPSTTQNKKRKLQSSNDAISVSGKDISDVMKMIVEITNEVRVLYKKVETLDEGVSKMTRMMMEKNKEVDLGFKKLGTLEEDVSRMTRMMMENNKEVVVGFKKLGTLEEDVSLMTRMMIEKNKEKDIGACYKMLETLEEDNSRLTRMMMEKNKEVDVGFKKLETLEEDVSKMAKTMMEKNIEDDMGACIEKLDKMGWGAEEPIYDTALLLFCQRADYRKLWLHLKPESCGKWVKNAGRMFGLLDC